MGYTMAQKILAAHCGRDSVSPGEIVNVKVDSIITGEVNAAMTFNDFDRLENASIYDKERIVVVPDHYAPNKDIGSAEQCKIVRLFCKKHELPHYYEVGQMGIEHVFMHEKGFVAPGDLVAGVDSHSCTYGALGAFSAGVSSTDMLYAITLGEIWLKVPDTMKITFKGKLPKGIGGKDLILYTIGKLGMDGARYKVIEFYGEALAELSMDSRFSLCNMAIECGAKCALMQPDELSLAYAKERCKKEFIPVYSDADASYIEEYEWDISELTPLVAIPPEPDRVYPVNEIMKKGEIPIEQSFIGSCTNGRLEDMRIAADIVRGHKVNPNVRFIVIPGSQEVYLDALREGILETLVTAGAAVSTPTCGPCVGGHMGLLASGERCVSTANRNFPGRMGHVDAEIYLTGPAVAAASAILGRLGLPEEVKGE